MSRQLRTPNTKIKIRLIFMFLEFLSETAVLAAAVTDIDSVVRR